MNTIPSHSSMKRVGKVVLTCDCNCGQIFSRRLSMVSSGCNFYNRQHAGAAWRAKYLGDMCGPYLSLVSEYLDGAAKVRYRRLSGVPTAICPFFRYLRACGVESLSRINSATITDFKVWALQNGYVAAATNMSKLRTFFHWLIVEELYEGENPVIPSVHSKPSRARTGRPYTDSEMAQIRILLEQRGNERLRAFFEIASESGMRNNEICRLRMEDMAIDTRTLQVLLPNKTMRERVAFFRDRASIRIVEWLRVRKSQSGHNFLFHNYLGDPLATQSIRGEFTRALCKTYRGRIMNETGLESFSIHRLRHTLSSTLANNGADANTLMTILGWVSSSSVDGYTRLSEDTKVRGFVSAMDNAEQQHADGMGRQVLTLDEFLLLNSEEAAL